jgi:amidase
MAHDPARIRRLTTIVTLLVAITTAGTTAAVDPGRLLEADVASLQSMMAAGDLTSEELTRFYLQRIERLDHHLNAVIAVNPEALVAARELDAERSEGSIRGPLHGIPILLKDNIESRDPVATTAGSLALAGNVTGRDAPLVARLRAAGAVILGKANLSEWANFRSERSSSGWSAVGGQARNPYDLGRSPCGSSSGSAVAVAANLTALAVGTETDGSVVCPATVNGIVGIKPTVGLISRTGIVPISHSQDTAGPMARTVAGAAALLQAMIGSDDADPATAIAEGAAGWSLAEHVRTDGLAGKRLGVVRSEAGFHTEVDALLEEAIAVLRRAGAEVVDGLELDPPDDLGASEYTVLLYEFKHDLNAYLAGLPDPQLSALTLESLIAFNRAHAADEMRWFDQEIFVKAQATGSLTDAEYLKALDTARQAAREHGIDRLLTAHRLDALAAPTGSPAWTIDLVNGDHYVGGSSTHPAVAGYPNITVPMGMVHGLPVGISFFGTALSEPTLLEVASGYEHATRHRRPPETGWHDEADREAHGR